MSIKILQLCLVLVSTFKEFVEFSLRSAAQLLKLQLQIKPLLKEIQFNSFGIYVCLERYSVK